MNVGQKKRSSDCLWRLRMDWKEGTDVLQSRDAKYLEWSAGEMSIHVCQKSCDFTPKICLFYYNKLCHNKKSLEFKKLYLKL